MNDALSSLARTPSAAHQTLVVFPGQGAQYVGMGRVAFEASSRARHLFECADQTLGWSVSQLCFEGPAEALINTRWQQPAIVTCSLAHIAAWEELYPDDAASQRPVAVAGHSLGEYSALVYAGAISFGSALRLAELRGALMQEAAERHPGGMSAVLGLSVQTLTAICAQATAETGAGEMVVLANHNSESQIVLSGTHAALARAGSLARERGARRVVPLAVAGAFHSPLMADAAARLADELAVTEIADTLLPVLANSTARLLRRADDIRAELAVQISAPVLWTETLRTGVRMGVQRCLDSGPGEVLANLARRMTPRLETGSLDRLLAARSAVAVHQ